MRRLILTFALCLFATTATSGRVQKRQAIQGSLQRNNNGRQNSQQLSGLNGRQGGERQLQSPQGLSFPSVKAPPQQQSRLLQQQKKQQETRKNPQSSQIPAQRQPQIFQDPPSVKRQPNNNQSRSQQQQLLSFKPQALGGGFQQPQSSALLQPLDISQNLQQRPSGLGLQVQSFGFQPKQLANNNNNNKKRPFVQGFGDFQPQPPGFTPSIEQRRQRPQKSDGMRGKQSNKGAKKQIDGKSLQPNIRFQQEQQTQPTPLTTAPPPQQPQVQQSPQQEVQQQATQQLQPQPQSQPQEQPPPQPPQQPQQEQPSQPQPQQQQPQPQPQQPPPQQEQPPPQPSAPQDQPPPQPPAPQEQPPQQPPPAPEQQQAPPPQQQEQQAPPPAPVEQAQPPPPQPQEQAQAQPEQAPPPQPAPQQGPPPEAAPTEAPPALAAPPPPQENPSNGAAPAPAPPAPPAPPSPPAGNAPLVKRDTSSLPDEASQPALIRVEGELSPSHQRQRFLSKLNVTGAQTAADTFMHSLKNLSDLQKLEPLANAESGPLIRLVSSEIDLAVSNWIFNEEVAGEISATFNIPRDSGPKTMALTAADVDDLEIGGNNPTSTKKFRVQLQELIWRKIDQQYRVTSDLLADLSDALLGLLSGNGIVRDRFADDIAAFFYRADKKKVALF